MNDLPAIAMTIPGKDSSPAIATAAHGGNIAARLAGGGLAPARLRTSTASIALMERASFSGAAPNSLVTLTLAPKSISTLARDQQVITDHHNGPTILFRHALCLKAFAQATHAGAIDRAGTRLSGAGTEKSFAG